MVLIFINIKLIIIYEMYFNSSINLKILIFMIMSVIFDQGSKPSKIPLLPQTPLFPLYVPI